MVCPASVQHLVWVVQLFFFLDPEQPKVSLPQIPVLGVRVITKQDWCVSRLAAALRRLRSSVTGLARSVRLGG